MATAAPEEGRKVVKVVFLALVMDLLGELSSVPKWVVPSEREGNVDGEEGQKRRLGREQGLFQPGDAGPSKCINGNQKTG